MLAAVTKRPKELWWFDQDRSLFLVPVPVQVGGQLSFTGTFRDCLEHMTFKVAASPAEAQGQRGSLRPAAHITPVLFLRWWDAPPEATASCRGVWHIQFRVCGHIPASTPITWGGISVESQYSPSQSLKRGLRDYILSYLQSLFQGSWVFYVWSFLSVCLSLFFHYERAFLL